MEGRKLKYESYLKAFPNCPPSDYEKIEKEVYRWGHSPNNENEYKPLNLINAPPQRILDNTHILCKGYGLSMFDTHNNTENQYKKHYRNKRGLTHEEYIEGKGECIAILKVFKEDGVAGDYNGKTGHFTFHEYENANLSVRVTKIFNIFDENGRFISDTKQE